VRRARLLFRIADKDDCAERLHHVNLHVWSRANQDLQRRSFFAGNRKALRFSFLMLFGIVAATSLAVAQTLKITSLSKISAQQYQTIVITGNGFGTQQLYTGDSPYISFNDNTRVLAGRLHR
jgi:hypothetical protein